MIRRCELTEMAAKLSLQLEASRIPDDFDASGEAWEVIARVRDRYTNYRALAAQLPACHDGCPLHSNAAEPVPGTCLTYEFAHYVLKREAKHVALPAYSAWHARRTAPQPAAPLATIAVA